MRRVFATVGAASAFAIVGLPFLFAAFEVVGEAEALGRVVEAGTIRLLVSSLGYAALVAVTSFVLALTYALSLSSVSTRFGIPLMFAGSIPALIPSYAYAVAWIELGGLVFGSGLRSYAFAVLCHGILLFPIALLFVLFALVTSDADGLRAATMHRSRAAVLWSVWLPQRGAVLFAGCALPFFLALSSYTVPAMFQIDLYPVLILSRFNAFYDAPGAIALTIPLVLLAVLAGTIGMRLSSRSVATSMTSALTPIGPPANFARALLLTILMISVCAPLAVLVVRTGSVASLQEALHATAPDFLTGAVVANAAAGIALAITILLSRGWMRTQIPVLATSAWPLLATGPVFGMALVAVWNHAGMRGAVYDSAGILIVAEAGRVLLLVLAIGWLAFSMIDRDQLRAARLTGRSDVVRFLRIELPLAYPGLCLAGLLAFVFAFGDAGPGSILTPPGVTPIAVRVAGLMHYGPSATVAALCLVNAGIAVLCAATGIGIVTHGVRRR